MPDYIQETDEEIIVDVEQYNKKIKIMWLIVIIVGVATIVVIVGVIILILGIIAYTKDDVYRFKQIHKEYEEKARKKGKRAVYTNFPPGVEEFYKQMS